jgi:hypothetical protein
MNKRLGWNVGRDWHDALASVLVYRALTKTAASSDGQRRKFGGFFEESTYSISSEH